MMKTKNFLRVMAISLWLSPAGFAQDTEALSTNLPEAAPPPVAPAAPALPRPEATQNALLANGLLAEEGGLDPRAAMEAYQAVIGQFDATRPAAATAVYRLGECYRKLGRLEEAKVYYARILREFPDQAQLVAQSQRYLFGPPTASAATTFQNRLTRIVSRGEARPPSVAPDARAAQQDYQQRLKEVLPRAPGTNEPVHPNTTRPQTTRQQEFLREEIKLAETQLENAQKRFEVGHGSQEEILQVKRDFLGLKRQLAALEEGLLTVDFLKGGEPISKQINEADLPSGGIEAAGEEKEPGKMQSKTAAKSTEVQYFYVVGAVRNAGRQIYQGELTVLKAIATAGDFTDFARLSGVRLSRQDSKEFVINVDQARRDSSLDLPVLPGDMIYVPKRIW